MEPIKRKRVTRVGSGAFSIYLPKKWMDTWAPNPDDPREVDLHLVNEGLLIVPAALKRSVNMSVDAHPATIHSSLLSAYVRGVDNCVLTPTASAFSNDAIGSARDLLRHLDERIVATCSPDSISFSLDPDLPPPSSDGADILRVMGAKIMEMLGLAAEAVETFGTDPDRCLHAMALVDAMQREDVQRLFHQALRSVARIELPMDSVSDFQFLDLLASHLERIGNHMLRMTDVLLAEYDLTASDLDYPRRHLLEKIGPRDPLPSLGREMVAGYRRNFAEISDLLGRTLAAVGTRDSAALQALQIQAEQLQKASGHAVFTAVAQHWGEEADEATARVGFALSKLASLLADICHATGAIARHGTILSAAGASQ